MIGAENGDRGGVARALDDAWRGGNDQIRERITVDASGKTYRGTFALNQFDVNGNLLAHFAGKVIALRVTADWADNGEITGGMSAGLQAACRCPARGVSKSRAYHASSKRVSGLRTCPAWRLPFYSSRKRELCERPFGRLAAQTNFGAHRSRTPVPASPATWGQVSRLPAPILAECWLRIRNRTSRRP